MNDYAATLRKHRRLAILRFLKDSAEYTANGSIIRDVLNGLGVTSTADQVTTELVWLRENGFITVEDLGPVLLATATTRGVEIAQGVTTHPDIQRPGPKV